MVGKMEIWQYWDYDTNEVYGSFITTLYNLKIVSLWEIYR
jgi:hypothetical protein